MSVIVVCEMLAIARLTARLVQGLTTDDVEDFIDYSAALAAVKRPSVRALIVDAGGYGAPGADLIVAARAANPDVLIVAMTTATYAGTKKEDLYDLGADKVIEMPFAADELVNAVGQGLRISNQPDVIVVRAGVESPGFDYKEVLYLSSLRDRASFAKDVIAMANYGGGSIVVGFKESSPGQFEPVGLTAAELAGLEITRVNKAIDDFLDPGMAVSVKRVLDDGKVFVLLQVPAARKSLVFAARENTDVSLYCGRIYSRSNACESAEVKTSWELRELLERLAARGH